MAKSFYGNLAVNNIRKNGRGYIPYMLTCIFSIMIFYIMVAIVYNPDLTKMLGGDTLKAMPVSYTHLDVYKRQKQSLLKKPQKRRLMEIMYSRTAPADS